MICSLDLEPYRTYIMFNPAKWITILSYLPVVLSIDMLLYTSRVVTIFHNINKLFDQIPARKIIKVVNITCSSSVKGICDKTIQNSESYKIKS